MQAQENTPHPESKKRTADDTDSKARQEQKKQTLDTSRQVKSKPEINIQESGKNDSNTILQYNKKYIDLSKKMKNNTDQTTIVSNDLSCQFIAVVTNNVKKSSDNNKEQGKTYTSFSFVPVKILNAGYIKAPYEAKPSNNEGANSKRPGASQINPKHRLYTDKDGKPLEEYKPTDLCNLQVLENENIAVFKSYALHPNNALKNTCRGLATMPVGIIKPGVPMQTCIFDDSKVNIMENNDTEEDLCEFSFALVSVRVRSKDQCDRGYGIAVKKISSLPGLCAQVSMHFPFNFLYNDRMDIGMQTSKIMNEKLVITDHNDLEFVKMAIKSNESDDAVYERPLVNLKIDENSSYTVREQANGDYIELLVNDSNSIYNGMCLKVNLHKSQFDTTVTPKPWICQVYQFFISSKRAHIVVLHNDYVYKKCKENNTQYLLEASIVIDDASIFTEHDDLTINQNMCNQFLPIINIKETLTAGENRYSAWCIHSSVDLTERYIFVIDNTKIYTPIAKNEQIGSEKLQISNIYFIHKNMNVDARVWVGYLCLLRDNNIVYKLPVGINAFSNSNGVSNGAVEMPSDIYANPWTLV